MHGRMRASNDHPPPRYGDDNNKQLGRYSGHGHDSSVQIMGHPNVYASSATMCGAGGNGSVLGGVDVRFLCVLVSYTLAIWIL